MLTFILQTHILLRNEELTKTLMDWLDGILQRKQTFQPY